MIAEENREPMPANLKRWNWGAFFLTWIWGLGNHTYIGFSIFLVFIGTATLNAILVAIFPQLSVGWLVSVVTGVSFVYMLFMHVLHGLKGNEWAWSRIKWKSAKTFVKVQRRWALVGFILWISLILIFVGVFSRIARSPLLQQSIRIAKQSSNLQTYLGKPITVSLFSVRGGFSTTDDTGKAMYKFIARGPKNETVVYIFALKENNQWTIKEEIAIVPGNNKAEKILLYGAKNYIHFGS